MIGEAIIGGIVKVLDWILMTVPGINFDMGGFGDALNLLIEGSKSMNVLLPIKESLVFLIILLGIKMALLAFWAATRIINLIRGAG